MTGLKNQVNPDRRICHVHMSVCVHTNAHTQRSSHYSKQFQTLQYVCILHSHVCATDKTFFFLLFSSYRTGVSSLKALDALLDLEQIRVDTKRSDGSTCARALDDETVGEVFGRELDDVVAALERGKRMRARVSAQQIHDKHTRSWFLSQLFFASVYLISFTPLLPPLTSTRPT